MLCGMTYSYKWKMNELRFCFSSSRLFIHPKEKEASHKTGKRTKSRMQWITSGVGFQDQKKTAQKWYWEFSLKAPEDHLLKLSKRSIIRTQSCVL